MNCKKKFLYNKPKLISNSLTKNADCWNGSSAEGTDSSVNFYTCGVGGNPTRSEPWGCGPGGTNNMGPPDGSTMRGCHDGADTAAGDAEIWTSQCDNGTVPN